MFTVCVLLYGNYPSLAKRVLESLSSTHLVKEFRLGLNAVSQDTSSFVHDWMGAQNNPVTCYMPCHAGNVGKYPLMSRMFADMSTAFVMWFDDDSYLGSVDKCWWETVKINASAFDVYGSLHRIRQRGKQYLAIPQQPWFNGKPVAANHIYSFATGGWWVGNVEFLRKWNYPFPQLKHNGGDSILGELVRQQKARLGQVNKSLARCHCEACSKSDGRVDFNGVNINVGGRAGRRGIGIINENYVFSNGDPFPSLEHQSFELEIFRNKVKHGI